MADPWQVLGVSRAASQEELRHAYHDMVKRWHPDRFTDEKEKETAQLMLTDINLAYQQAIKQLPGHSSASYSHELDLFDAKHLALKMEKQGDPATALRELLRADRRDAEWYAIQGRLLLTMEQYESASQSWRQAVSREPNNLDFRRGALQADIALKNSRTLKGKLKRLFHSKR